MLTRRFNAAAALLEFSPPESLQAACDDEPVDSETKSRHKKSDGSASTGRQFWPVDLFLLFFLSVSGQITVLADTSFPPGDSREGE